MNVLRYPTSTTVSVLFSEDQLSKWKQQVVENVVTLFESSDKQSNTSLNDSEDITEAKARVEHFIAQVYHQKHPHSALGYLTPIEF